MHIFHKYETLRTKYFSKNIAFKLIEESPSWRFYGLDALKVLEFGYKEIRLICIECGKPKIEYCVNRYPYDVEMLQAQSKDVITEINRSVLAICKSRNLLNADII